MPGRPVPQPRHMIAVVGGKPVTYVPADHPVRAWVDTVRTATRAAWAGPPAAGPVRMDVFFLLPRPGRMGPGPREVCPARPDCDNLTKAFLDAVKTVAIVDDDQVVDLWVVKAFAAAGEGPFAAARIEECGPAPPPGWWDGVAAADSSVKVTRVRLP